MVASLICVAKCSLPNGKPLHRLELGRMEDILDNVGFIIFHRTCLLCELEDFRWRVACVIGYVFRMRDVDWPCDRSQLHRSPRRFAHEAYVGLQLCQATGI